MLKDNIPVSRQNSFRLDITKNVQDTRGIKAIGEYSYVLREGSRIVEAKEGKNIVTVSAGVILAMLLKDSSIVSGVTHFAVGSGDPGWNITAPPAPSDQAEELIAEVGRTAPIASNYIDPDTGLVSMTPTNIVDWDFHFGESEAVGFLVEGGLIANGQLLITNLTFPVISKTLGMDLDFTYRLTM